LEITAQEILELRPKLKMRDLAKLTFGLNGF